MANLEGDLKLISQPGSVEYRPDPNDLMDLQTLQENRAYLMQRLTVWESRKSQPGSRKKWVNNAQKGIDIMKGKIALYDRAISSLSSMLSVPVVESTSQAGAGSTDSISLSSSPASTAGKITALAGIQAAVNNPQGFFTRNKKVILIGAGVLIAAVITFIVIKKRK